MPALTCAPPSVTLNTYPCLQCLSEKDLLAILVYSMAQSTSGDTAPEVDYSNNLKQLLVDSSCWAGLAKKQMLIALVTMNANLFVAGKTVAQLRDSIKCIQCASQKQLMGAFMLLMCAEFQVAPTEE